MREARKTLSRWRQDASPEETRSCEQSPLVHTSRDIQNGLALTACSSNTEAEETRCLITRCQHPYVYNDAFEKHVSKARTCENQTKRSSFSSFKLTRDLFNDALGLDEGIEEEKISIVGMGKSQVLSTNLSFSDPELHCPMKHQDDDCCHRLFPEMHFARNIYASRQIESVLTGIFTTNGLITRNYSFKHNAFFKKRLSLPNVTKTSKSSVSWIRDRKHRPMIAADKARDPEETLKINTINHHEQKDFEILCNQYVTGNTSRELKVHLSSTSASSQTIQTDVKETSVELSSSTPETSTSAGSDPPCRVSERNTKRRKNKIRFVSQRPGSLKLKRQLDSKSRQRTDPQKASHPSIISSRFQSQGSRAQLSPLLSKVVKLKESGGATCASPKSSSYRPKELLETGSAGQFQSSQSAGPISVTGHKRQNRTKPLGIKNLDMIRTLFVVFVCMAVFMSPYMVTIMADVHDKWPALVHCACSYLAVVNNAINWMLYGMLNSSFRAGYRSVMLGLCSKRGTIIQTAV